MKQTARVIVAAFAAWLLAFAAPAWADSPGKNGARTITAANTIVNQSTTLAAAAAAETVAVIGLAPCLAAAVAAGIGAVEIGEGLEISGVQRLAGFFVRDRRRRLAA